MAKQVGPPVRRGPYLISVVDDDTDVLVRAIDVDQGGKTIDENRADVVYVTENGIRFGGSGNFVPHDVLIAIMKIAGII